MCGIAGRAGRDATDAPSLRRMAAAMSHRGPDGEGIWHDSEAGLAFRRLAIIDLHERSNQPLHLDQLHLVLNGEIYNYIELRERLRQLGHRFATEGDAEVLLHAWAEWGETALDHLNGMFALAVWNAAEGSMTLATDRFAEKPLFYHYDSDRLMFASDVRALRAADSSVGVPDLRAATRFAALESVPMPTLPSTFFSDVHRLPPAHLARWTPTTGLEVRCWWKPRVVDVPNDPGTAASRLRELLTESVRIRLRSDVPVGTSLSGGVDSSAVAALMSELAPDHNRHAFTATFPGFERDEWDYAESAARAAGVQTHHPVRPEIEEMLDDLSRLVAFQEEPFGTTSIYAQWRVMHAAREAGIIVLLDGQGADELFGGYEGIEGWALRSLGFRRALSAALRNPRISERLAIAYSAGRAPEAIARRHRLRFASPYVSHEVAREVANDPEPLPKWIATAPPLRRQLLTESFRTSLPSLCRFADRDSMAFGVEVRLPFLDPNVAEYALSLPPELAWRDEVTKWTLRRAVRGLVPDVILDRRDKVGFEPPQARWFATEPARERIGSILLDRDSRAPVVRSEVERDIRAGAWRDHRAIWRAVNVALWLEQWQPTPTTA